MSREDWGARSSCFCPPQSGVGGGDPRYFPRTPIPFPGLCDVPKSSLQTGAVTSLCRGCQSRLEPALGGTPCSHLPRESLLGPGRSPGGPKSSPGHAVSLCVLPSDARAPAAFHQWKKPCLLLASFFFHPVMACNCGSSILSPDEIIS